MSSIERLWHLFEKWDRAKDEFLEAKSRERMILDVVRREQWPHIDEPERPE